MLDIQNIIDATSTTCNYSVATNKRTVTSTGFGFEAIGKKFEDAVKGMKHKDKAKLDKGFEEVMKHFKFKGYSKDESKKGAGDSELDGMKDKLKSLYYGSPTARKMLDELAKEPFTHIVDINNKKDLSEGANSKTSKSLGLREVNVSTTFDGTTVKNENGLLFAASVERTLAHELVHSIYKTDDKHSTKEPMGNTVRITNQIMKELKSSDCRVDYASSK